MVPAASCAAVRAFLSSDLDALHCRSALAVIVLLAFLPVLSCTIYTVEVVPPGVLPFWNFACSRTCLV